MPAAPRRRLTSCLVGAALAPIQPIWADDAPARVAMLNPQLGLATLTTQMVLASPASRSGAARLADEASSAQHLQLEVSLNGQLRTDPLEVEQASDGSLSVAANDWRALGLVVASTELDAQGRVPLAGLHDVKVEFNAEKQHLALTLPAERFARQFVDMRGMTAAKPDATPLSATFNYDTFVQHVQPPYASGTSTQLAGLFGGRLSGRWGNFNQTASAQTATLNNPGPAVRRLDSTYSYFDQSTMETWQVGDAISAGLASRPAIRFGGMQWRRDFSLRPDLVTFPMPMLSGSSAVPTTVDVIVDQVKRASTDLSSGPFTLNQLPVMAGPNDMQVVVRDALGREQLTTMSLFASPLLLKPGLLDFAVQSGFSRLNYASNDDTYNRYPFFIGSARYGLNQSLTLEGQSEYSRDVSLLSAGAVTLIGQHGTLGLDAAGSSWQGEAGGEVSGTLNYYFTRQLILNGAFSEASGAFRDTATVVGAYTPLRSRRQLSISQGFDTGSNLSLSWIEQHPVGQADFSLMSATAAQRVARDGYVTLTGWRSLASDHTWGASLGISWFLGGRRSVNAYTQKTSSGSTSAVSAQSTLPLDPGWGWNVAAATGQNEYRRAELDNRNRFNDLTAQVEDGNAGQAERLGATGAVVWMPGTVQAGRRIGDAFALVDIGYPDVSVFFENRPVGRTDKDGYLLVNDLNAYQRNKLSLEALDLPLDVTVGDAQRLVVPSRGSGVRVNFDIERNTETLLALRRPDGHWAPVGARIQLHDGEQRVIGYDGQVLVPASSAGQTLDVFIETDRCALTLPAKLTPDQQHVQVLELTCP